MLLVEWTKFLIACREYYNNPNVVNMLKETNECFTKEIIIRNIYILTRSRALNIT